MQEMKQRFHQGFLFDMILHALTKSKSTMSTLAKLTKTKTRLYNIDAIRGSITMFLAKQRMQILFLTTLGLDECQESLFRPQ